MRVVFLALLLGLLQSCDDKHEIESYPYTFMTLNPGHFHAGLVQKTMYDDVSPDAYVYAPAGPDLERHLALVRSYNQRDDNPTQWNEHIYTDADHETVIWKEKPGNVLILSGNNAEKFRHIRRAVTEGVHVFADKPMIIKQKDYEALVELLDEAGQKDLMVYDIMTERYEVTTRLQRKLAGDSLLTGGLRKGSPEMPTIEKHSVHFLSKVVSGKQLVRPEWFLDIKQQGRPVADVGTHLVDLILWTLNGEHPIDTSRVELLSASEWNTELDHERYSKITSASEFPDFLQSSMNTDSILELSLNGKCTFKVDDYHATYSVEWGFEAIEGGDTHYSIIRGNRVNLEIIQGAEEGFIPQLYIVPLESEIETYRGRIDEIESEIQSDFPGTRIVFQQDKNRWRLDIPDELRIGHEAHFAQVTDKYLDYLQQNEMPQWEVDFMKTKYFITTRADRLAQIENEL